MPVATERERTKGSERVMSGESTSYAGRANGHGSTTNAGRAMKEERANPSGRPSMPRAVFRKIVIEAFREYPAILEKIWDWVDHTPTAVRGDFSRGDAMCPLRAAGWSGDGEWGETCAMMEYDQATINWLRMSGQYKPNPRLDRPRLFYITD